MTDLWTPIDLCELSTRARNVLVNEGYRTLGDVVQAVAEDVQHPTHRDQHGEVIPFAILRLPNCGKNTATEIMQLVGPLLPADPLDVRALDDFHSWCERNRPILEMLRRGFEP